MTITEMIKQLGNIADTGIVNYAHDTEVLREAASMIRDLARVAFPQWNNYVVFCDGLYLADYEDGHSKWTGDIQKAEWFVDQSMAQDFANLVGGIVRRYE